MDNTDLRYERTHSSIGRLVTERLHGPSDDQLLDDLGIEVIPASRFNDDDGYIFNPQTLELLAVVGPSARRTFADYDGAVIRMGLSAKHLGLWRRIPFNPSNHEDAPI